MYKYKFKYAREQQVLIEVEASNIDEATRQAWKQTKKLSLDSRDDQSTDIGVLYLEDIKYE